MTGTSSRTSLDGFHESRATQQADELARTFVSAMNSGEEADFEKALARNFQSYSVDGARSRSTLQAYYQELRRSFSDLHFQVHENVGVIVENDLIAMRTLVTGTHDGAYQGVQATEKKFQTSVSHMLRFREDKLVEQWHIMDTYRILVTIGAVPGAAKQYQEMLKVPPGPGGIFLEKDGTPFGAERKGKIASADESRAVNTLLYDGAISTGKAEDVEALAPNYIQNTGWTPDTREHFGKAWAFSRGMMPDGRSSATHTVAEKDRVASFNVWDGTVVSSGTKMDFQTFDFLRIEEHVAAEHWDTVNYMALYEGFGLLPSTGGIPGRSV